MRAALALLVAAACGTAWAAEAPERSTLRFDPFAARTLSPAADPRKGADGAWSPVLKATLIGKQGSLVNFGGTILRIDEETHGYKLIEVREGEAVFLRDGLRVTLTVDPGARE